ncbi:hypothetical protein [Nocardia sp. NPDC050793]|uniref:hypothetical protein n=1 Tax=Nocardia sp. NPDC050793 TaxID=3155159 RepID=UPI0033C1F8A1
MRLRVLELPKQQLGHAVSTPYALVVDNCTAEQADMLHNAEGLAKTIGAIGVLVFAEPVVLAAPLAYTEPEARAIIEAAAAALGTEEP